MDFCDNLDGGDDRPWRSAGGCHAPCRAIDTWWLSILVRRMDRPADGPWNRTAFQSLASRWRPVPCAVDDDSGCSGCRPACDPSVAGPFFTLDDDDADGCQPAHGVSHRLPGSGHCANWIFNGISDDWRPP